MKNVKEINSSRTIVVRIDSSLDCYRDKVLFPEQLARANESLKNVKLPRRKPSQS